MTLRVPLAALYFVFLVWLGWEGGQSEDADGSVILLVLFWLALVGGSVVVGRLVGVPALAIPLLAIPLAAVVGEARGGFDNELKLANWVIQIAGSLVCVGFGVWLGVRRSDQTKPVDR